MYAEMVKCWAYSNLYKKNYECRLVITVIWDMSPKKKLCIFYSSLVGALLCCNTIEVFFIIMVSTGIILEPARSYNPRAILLNNIFFQGKIQQNRLNV